MRLLPRSVPLTLAALIAMLAAAAALAAPPNKAEALALQKSDFPAGTVVRPGGGSATATGSSYAVTFQYRTGTKPNELSAFVAVSPGRGVATAMFRELKSEMGLGVPKLKLPPYGDEQVADFSPLGGSRLLVRKGSVVWALELQTFLTRGGRTHELTKAEAIAEYKRYAPKQQRRVG
jgi:hypothetical protein